LVLREGLLLGDAKALQGREVLSPVAGLAVSIVGFAVRYRVVVGWR
jgi:hypothetical protein